MGFLIKTRWVFIFILFYVLRSWLYDQWEYSFWPFLPEGTHVRVHLVVIEYTWILRHEVTATFSLSDYISFQGSSPWGAFIMSTSIVLLVLEKSQPSNTFLASQIRSSVTGSISGSCGKQKTSFALTILSTYDNNGFCFLRLTLGVNILDLVRVAPFFGMPFTSFFKPYWFESILKLIWDPTHQWADNESLELSIFKRFFKENFHFKQLSYWYL